MAIPNHLPASTGKGTNVEATSQIIHTISNLAAISSQEPLNLKLKLNSINIPSSNPTSTGTESIGNAMTMTMATAMASNEESLTESKDEMEYMTMLSQTTQQFSDKCQLLLTTISNHKNANAGGSVKDVGSDDCEKNLSSDDDAQQQQDQDQLKEMTVMVEELRGHMEEMKKSRDDANERERRVRRGLYRVAAGRIEIGEVLKVRL
jgi:TolA-binding protein